MLIVFPVEKSQVNRPETCHDNRVITSGKSKGKSRRCQALATVSNGAESYCDRHIPEHWQAFIRKAQREGTWE